MHQIAIEKDGKCLSAEYHNSKSKLLWACNKGHQWNATPDNIRQGAWCHECGGSKKLTIEDMRQIAKDRNGKCLSQKYKNIQSKLEWECVNKHKWFSTPRDIRKGSWCHECGGSKKLTIEEMHKIAKERSGRCLSKKYIGISTKLEWECLNQHRWFATPRGIKNKGHWCPKCNINYKEELCRTIFEQIFQKKFIKSRPDWLRNSDGYLMELDGFCEEFKIDFE